MTQAIRTGNRGAILKKLCIKRGLNDFAMRDYLEELWGRKLVCECQIIEDPRERAKREILRVFGTDFEGIEIV